MRSVAEAWTVTTLRERLGYSLVAFGELKLRDLERMPLDVAEWRTTLPPGSRYGIAQALRQTLEASVRWGLMTRNPAKLAGSNPVPRQPEIEPFARLELDRLAVELGPWAPVAVVASETGLRPSEWIPLEWRDISRGDGAALVQRTFSRGRLKAYGTTDRSRRRVPLSTRALESLDSIPRRINSRLVFPAPGGGNRVRVGHGGYLDLHNWRAREWLPALDAAGLPRRRIYDLRHSFATWAIAAGPLDLRARPLHGYVGRMIDRTYGHLARGSDDVGARETRRPRSPRPGPFGPGLGHALAAAAFVENESPAFAGLSVSGRYWARTSDPQLVELVLSQLS